MKGRAIQGFRLLGVTIGILLDGGFATAAESSGHLNSDPAKTVLGLLPEAQTPYHAPDPDYLEEQLGRTLSGAELALLARDSTGTWKTFSDDLLAFELPDDPLLKVDLLSPEDRPRLRVVGGAVGTTDNSFQKVYRITFSDGAPYGLILVTAQPWFDEGICMCGPIALKSFLHLDGNLFELSQLPDGAVKKIQVINGTHRAILFEWTHSAITQSAYLRIGASLRFKTASTRTTADWIAISQEHRGFEAGLGWLRLGTTTDEAITLLGKPVEQTAERLVYIREDRDAKQRGWRGTLTLPFRDGRLVRFGAEWSSFEQLPAPRGTRAWVEDTVDSWSEAARELPEGEFPKLPEDDANLILHLFHKEARRAIGEDWDSWCGIIADLARLGRKQDAAANLVASRCHEENLPQHQAAWVLDLYDRPESQAFVKNRLRFLMGEAEAAVAARGECHNLFAFLEKNDPEALGLLRQGVRHQAEKVRDAAVFFSDHLPKSEAAATLRAALSDPSEGVRWSAILNIDGVFAKADEPWLREVLRSEKNERNRKELEKKITGLE